MAQKKKKSNARQRRNGYIVNVLTLIVLLLVVFEGKSVISLFSHADFKSQIKEQEQEVFASANLASTETEAETEFVTETEKADSETNASDDEKSAQTEESQSENTAETESISNDPSRITGIPDGCEDYLGSIVPAQHSPVPDSYFSDAVFVGDSRMEGFHHFSGITDSNFVTAVGMQLSNFYTDAQISTASGDVTALQALKNTNFSKIYMMLGTNELGAYDMEAVRDEYARVLNDIKTLASSENPIVYVFSVIYVEEALTEPDYVNNTNVDKVNAEILRMCQENGYHYINLNEIFADESSHSLLPGVSEDGVHLDVDHCKQWLEYTKYHYLPAV